ncbi:adaptin N terminal region-domain-containing protein [Lactarius sanguifluus]|nr:adaptin N terminal region-domain-containing protein [Lactarius sanguifluus]
MQSSSNAARFRSSAETKDKKFTKRKTVLKKIVANITMGMIVRGLSYECFAQVSALFVDVVQCLGTPLLEIKKMVYLFLINYGRAKADSIHMVIPNFLQDCNDRNPLIRALAIRTMSYIPIPVVLDNLTEQLRHHLKDRDPYVRKTAAICVAKLYAADPRKAERGGFVELLRDLLVDSNVTVVGSIAVARLTLIYLSCLGTRVAFLQFRHSHGNECMMGITTCVCTNDPPVPAQVNGTQSLANVRWDHAKQRT